MKDTENRPPSRKRRKWGSVIVRRDTDGNPTSFQARYVNPLDPPKKVGRNFGLEYETEAYKWLDEEHYLVTLVLLQCLFDRFGSVFPQCGLMVFPGVVIVSR